MRTLSDRVAVVTGAGSGIGRATSVALARRGAHVAVLDVDEARARETAGLVQGAGRRATVHLVDVRDAGRLDQVAGEVVHEHGGCHVLVNNAGVTSAGGFEQESLEDLQWIVDINVWGVVHATRAFLPLLREAEEAHVINLSSMVGLLGLPHNAAYSLTKGAVRGFSEALRAELITTDVGVSAVFPGAIRTGITAAARGTHAGRLAAWGSSPLAPVAMRPPEAVARSIIRAIEHDRARVVVGPDARVVDLLTRVVPGRSGLVGRLTARVAP